MRSKNLWIGGTIAIIWLAVLITSLNSPELTFGDEPVVIRVAAIANWFWGVLATIFVLRSTIFRRPNEMGWGQTVSWPWITAITAVLWLVAMLASLNAPSIDVNETISVPIAAIVAPPVAVALTLYACEFLITGFAARRPLDGADTPGE